MSRKYKIRDQNQLYFVTFSVVDWVDVFTRQLYRDILIDSLKYCIEHKRLEVYAYCIMSNHVHMIIGQSGETKIEGIVRDIKKFTSYKITSAIMENQSESRSHWMLRMFEYHGSKNINNKKYQFWQQHSHPIELNSNELMDQKLDYIHQNPVKSGIVLSPEEYLYSSAKNYYGLGHESLLDVILIN